MKGLDGTMIREVLVPKDTVIFVGALSSNQNKRIWGEDALEWKPERWLSPLPESLVNARIPGIYSHWYVIGYSAAGAEDRRADECV